jgi:sec-independent protein translocase protein TatA
MLNGLGNPVHLMLVFVVLFVLSGANPLPEMGRSIGTGLRAFKQGLTAA